MGTYSESERHGIRCYYVFCHAAIEWYLEQRCIEVAKRAEREFVQRGRVRKALLGLAMCTDTQGSKNDAMKPTSVRVTQLVAQYFKKVEANHGIAERNVRALLHPIAVEASELDPPWLAEMTTLGSRRGENAHRALWGCFVSHTPNPQEAAELVQRLVRTPGGQGLKGLDALLDKK